MNFNVVALGRETQLKKKDPEIYEFKKLLTVLMI